MNFFRYILIFGFKNIKHLNYITFRQMGTEGLEPSRLSLGNGF